MRWVNVAISSLFKDRVKVEHAVKCNEDIPQRLYWMLMRNTITENKLGYSLTIVKAYWTGCVHEDTT